MIVQCSECSKYYDDEFRNTSCPHDTFLANDGENNFKHYSEAWLSDRPPMAATGAYRKWLEKNKIKTPI